MFKTRLKYSKELFDYNVKIQKLTLLKLTLLSAIPKRVLYLHTWTIIISSITNRLLSSPLQKNTVPEAMVPGLYVVKEDSKVILQIPNSGQTAVRPVTKVYSQWKALTWTRFHLYLHDFSCGEALRLHGTIRDRKTC